MNSKIIIALVTIIFFSACPIKNSKTCDIQIINNRNQPVSLCIEIADTDELRAKGLMHRKQLERNNGMLFVFDYDDLQQFWMKDTFIPLSIAYIDNKGVIKELYDMKPLDISVRYPSKMPARYALEANQGWFAKNNIIIGCKIILNGCLSK